jgi:translation initiation factor IF-2
MAKTKSKTKATTPKTPKPPVVTIMGHVDHGKTTLLDHIRQTQLAATEAGGITQSIGAYQVTVKNHPITFIDTPGHAAFSNMRARGAAVTDIVVLVVAADDGVMPQTKESIAHIKTANVPVIVAITKIDLKNAIPEMAKAQLVESDVKVEGYGGSVPVVEVSALKGTGVDKLLETILVLAELEDLTADPNAPLEAVVIEASLVKDLGPQATFLVKSGTLHQGDTLISVNETPSVTGKAKRLTSDTGATLTSAGPSTPVSLLGLKTVPAAGAVFTTPAHLATIQPKYASKPKPTPEPPQPVPDQPSEPETETETEQKDTQDQVEKLSIKIILLADNQGSLEAISHNLTEELELIKASTGQVTESDVLLAQSTGAAIIAFNVPISRSARKLASLERVPIKTYTIIYQLLEDFEKQILKLLEPTIDEQELGTAKIKAIFTIKNQLIAGCEVTSGRLSLEDKVHLKRAEKIISDAKIISLKQGKIDVKTVDQGNQCGLVLKPQLKLAEGDIITAYTKVEG